jgi:hypothetical protein
MLLGAVSGGHRVGIVGASSVIVLEDLLGVENFDLGFAELLLDELHGSVALGLLGLGGVNRGLNVGGRHGEWLQNFLVISL